MNLLLVEDDADFAATTAAALRGFDHRVTIAGDGRAALSALACESFDAMILDRMLPHIDGLSVLERLRGGRATLPVIMLSARGQSDAKVDGLVAGADDYVVKPVDAAELNARLHALLRGRGFAQGGDDTLRAGDITVSSSRFRAWRAERPIDLVKLELKLLLELVRHADRVMTRAMLIEKVWGYDFEPETNLVDVYIRRLRLKLCADGGSDPIVTMRGVGYMLKGG
ncbi:response regulator transcription factor [Sphingomonas sp. S-NIH.Pt15_0812]|jgi:two-component system OmpR family response regulator|uniref:response regulator transcription factor n=1 Tax=Sphingomonas sp. S-NIH.Pt15_0812 TaxID=1920129 RepID=UPI000F7DADCD|nr:response regulator transcription factor [Sphingomonas sp. S-NIH.Pt15_0812]RSU48341.1 DNA-binding response regulator [Sphingomonas sp. S-NIH.Pt15_0812]